MVLATGSYHKLAPEGCPPVCMGRAEHRPGDEKERQRRKGRPPQIGCQAWTEITPSTIYCEKNAVSVSKNAKKCDFPEKTYCNTPPDLSSRSGIFLSFFLSSSRFRFGWELGRQGTGCPPELGILSISQIAVSVFARPIFRTAPLFEDFCRLRQKYSTSRQASFCRGCTTLLKIYAIFVKNLQRMEVCDE